MFSTIQPVMFVLLFGYVFDGASGGRCQWSMGLLARFRRLE
ncbi:MAG: hypothetical protein ACR2HR_11910 [Euzebya sp.]